MRTGITRAAITAATALTLGLLGISTASAATSHPAVPAGPAVTAHPADFPDGYPDVDPDTIGTDIAQKMCQSSSPGLCMNISGGTVFASNSNSTPIKWKFNGNTFTTGGHTYNVGTLNAPSQSPACIGTNGFGNLVLANCTTGTGIIWAAGLSNGHHVFINRKGTQDRGVLTVFASNNGNGSVAFIAQWPPVSGVYERYDFSAAGAAAPMTAGAVRFHHRTLAQRAAYARRTMARAAAAGDTVIIHNVNGQQNCAGIDSFGTFQPVIQKSINGINCYPLDENFVTLDPQGFPEYRFALNNPETLDIASTNACDKVTTKGPAGNGTVFIIYNPPNTDNLYLVPRYCVPVATYNVRMGGDNTLQHQWLVVSGSGWYTAMAIQ